MGASPGVTNQKEALAKAAQRLTPDAANQYKLIMDRLEFAKSQRERAGNVFLDGMSFTQDYYTNQQNRNTYLTPKKNDAEVRVNTGTSERKLDAIKNELLTMDINFDIKAFDQDDSEIQELGDDMTDLVRRTNQQENDEDFNDMATDELLTQRITYAKDSLVQKNVRQPTSQLKKQLSSGLKVFPGDMAMHPFNWDLQPFTATYNRYPFDTARMLYDHLTPFKKHVMPDHLQRYENIGPAFSYRFGALADGEVEVVEYESLVDDECQIIINGVPMYEPNEPLSYSYPMYQTQAFVIKPMSPDYLLGRPFPAMAKTMQALSNETIRLLVRKFQQAVNPPIGTSRTGKIYSRDIWNPNTITQGLGKNDFSKLVDHSGVTDGDMGMYRLVEEKVEEWIGAFNLSTGAPSGKQMSATEATLQQKQFLKQLGYTVFAKMRMTRVMTQLRIYNIYEHYLDPVRKKMGADNKPFDVYRSFTVDGAKYPDGKHGKKVIYLINNNLSEQELKNIYDHEREQEALGNPVRVKFLNVPKMKEFPKYWHITTNVQDKEGTTFDKLMFQDQFTQAAAVAQVTGKPLNGDVITEDFERKWKAKDWFQEAPPQGIPGQPNSNQSQDDTQANQQKAKDIMQEAQGMMDQGTQGAQMARGLNSGQKEVAAQMTP